MTALTTAPDRVGVSTPSATRSAIAAELTRLTTVRSTWWSLAGAAGMYVVLSLAFGNGSAMGEPVTTPGEAGLLFAQFALYIPVVLGIAGAYSSGSIRTALQAIPRRGVFLAARWVVLVASSAVAAMLLALFADGIAALVIGGLQGADAGSIARSVAMIGVVVAFGSTIAVGLAFTLRSTAGVITTMFLLMLVLPLVLPAFGIELLTDLSRYTPGKAMFSLLDAFIDETALWAGQAWAVFAGWSLAAMGTGAASLIRRDAA